MVSDRLISPWELIHFGLVIKSCDRSFRTSSVICYRSASPEIRNTILNAPAKKCPGLDGIPYEILKLAFELLLPHFHQIFNSCFTIGYYLSHFKTLVIVVLRKLAGKRDYTQAKSYRPIALLNIMSKIFEIIMAHQLSFMTEVH